jgi:hypothetical protein
MHKTGASRLNVMSNTRTNKGVPVYEVAYLARKPQEREWVSRHGLNDLLRNWSLVVLVIEEFQLHG